LDPLAIVHSVPLVEDAIEAFIRFLAVERGLSSNYQLSTQRSLSDFADWCRIRKDVVRPSEVTLPLLTEYLAERKRSGLSAASIKLIVVALKIFFRFLTGRGSVRRDPAEGLSLPRIERCLPETLNELQVEKLIESIKYDHRSERAWLQLASQEQLEVRVRKVSFEHRQGPTTRERTVSSRIGRIMALAIKFGELLRTGEVRSLPELARRAGISTVRVSQILKLRNLAPAIQERLLFMAPDQAQYSEVKLRRAARETEWARQSAYLS